MSLRPHNRMWVLALDFRLFPLLFALFFHCFPLFLRWWPFSRLRKDLHCRRPAFSIADRLYFSESPSRQRA
jgi:hypothetical protein